MYHCTNCLTVCPKDQLVDTRDRIDVNQCQQCFLTQDLIFMYDFNSECKICFGNNTNCVFKKCGHTICLSCKINIHNKCPFCQVGDNLCTFVAAKNKYEFFDNTTSEIKEIFKNLFRQLTDTYDKKMILESDLYDILVEYYKFLNLLHMNDNNNHVLKLSPSHIIDKIWHAHLLDNHSYNATCHLICGYVLNHYVENSFKRHIDNYQARFDRTLELYEQKYGKVDNNVKWIWAQTKTTTDQITFTISTLGGQTYNLEMSVHATVDELKNKLSQLDKSPACTYIVIFHNQGLDNDKSLFECGIKNQSKLFAKYNLTGC